MQPVRLEVRISPGRSRLELEMRLYIRVHSFFKAFFRGVAGLESAAQAVFENCKEGVDLNQVVLSPRLSYLLIDSVTYPLFPLPPPSPLLFPIAYTFLMYIEALEPHSIDRVLIL